MGGAYRLRICQEATAICQPLCGLKIAQGETAVLENRDVTHYVGSTVPPAGLDWDVLDPAGNVVATSSSTNGWAFLPTASAGVSLKVASVAVVDIGYLLRTRNAGAYWIDVVPATPAAPPTDFSLSARPSLVSVLAGRTGQALLDITRNNNFAETITLTDDSTMPHPGVTVTVAPGTAAVGASSPTVTLSVGANVASNDYRVRIKGTATGGQTAYATLWVRVGSTVGMIACGDEVEGQLKGGGERYRFEATAGQPVTVTLASDAFDTVLYVVDAATNKVITFNDNRPGGSDTTNSSLTFVAPTSGLYYLEATSRNPGARGPYTLSVCCEPAPNAPGSAYPVLAPGDNAVLTQTGTQGPATPGVEWEIWQSGRLIATSALPGDTPHRWTIQYQPPSLNTSINPPAHIPGAILVCVPSGVVGGSVYEVRCTGFSQFFGPTSGNAQFWVPCLPPSRPFEMGRGLFAQYFGNTSFAVSPLPPQVGRVLERIDPVILFRADCPAKPVPELPSCENYSIRWTGFVRPRYTERYTFHLKHDDGVRLWVNGKLIINYWGEYDSATHSGTVDLEAGKFYDIRLDYYQGPAIRGAIGLEWESAHQWRQIVPEECLYPVHPDDQASNFRRELQPDRLRVVQGGAVNTSKLTVWDPVIAFNEPEIELLDGPAGITFTPTRDSLFSFYPAAFYLSFQAGNTVEPGVYPVAIKYSRPDGRGGTFSRTTPATLLVARNPNLSANGKRPRIPRGQSRQFPAEWSGEASAYPASQPSAIDTWEIVAPWGQVVAQGRTGNSELTEGWRVSGDADGVLEVRVPENGWVADNYEVRYWDADGGPADAQGRPTVLAISSHFDVVFDWGDLPPPATLVCGQPASGSLATTDAGSFVLGPNVPADRYALTLPAGQAVTLTLSGTGLDTQIHLYDPSGRLLDMSAASGASVSDTLTFTSLRPGAYIIEVTTAASAATRTGAYTLAAVCEDASLLVPRAPTNLVAVAVSTSGINLTWTDTNSDSRNEDGFRIESKREGSSVWRGVGSVGSGVTAFAHRGLLPGIRYTYRVLAYNAFGSSPYSNEAFDDTQGDELPLLRINTGGPAYDNFQMNVFWKGEVTQGQGGPPVGQTYFTGGAARTFVTDAANDAEGSDDAVLYRDARFTQAATPGGATFFTYTLLAPPGASPQQRYTLRLHFAEMEYTAPAGERKFNVLIHGQPALDAFDVAAAAGGPRRTLIKSFSVLADTSGQVVVRFEALAGLGEAMVSAIELLPEEVGGLGDSLQLFCGDNKNGALTTADPSPLGRTGANGAAADAYADRYTIQATKGQVLTFTLRAKPNAQGLAFDPHLYLLGPTGQVVAQNDNVGSGDGNTTPPPPPPPAPGPTSGLDTTTRGNWAGAYGADGFHIFDGTVALGAQPSTPSANGYRKLPAYVQASYSNGDGVQNWVWAATTNEVRALLKPVTPPAVTDPAQRIAASMYTRSTITFDLNFTDGQPHRVALYNLDWDRQYRYQWVRVKNATTGALIEERLLNNFGDGSWLWWTLSGHVKIEATWRGLTYGDNVSVQGLFFDPAPNAPTPTGAPAERDARIVYTVPETGAYTVEATSSPNNPWGKGEYTLSAECATAPPTVPAPSALSAQARPSERTNLVDRIELNWQHLMPDGVTTVDPATYDGFVVERRNEAPGSSTAFAELGRVATGVRTYTDANLAPSKIYTYRVKALKKVGGADIFSAASNEARANTHQVPPVVSILKPLPNALLTGASVPLELAASAGDGATLPLAQVVVEANGALVPVTLTRTPGSATRYTGTLTLSAGAHTLVARVTDSNGLPGQSGAITVIAASSNILPKPVVSPDPTTMAGAIPAISISHPWNVGAERVTVRYTVAAGAPGAPVKPVSAASDRYVGRFVPPSAIPNGAGSVKVVIRARAYLSEMVASDEEVVEYTITQIAMGGQKISNLLVPEQISEQTLNGLVFNDIVPLYGNVSGSHAAWWKLSYRRASFQVTQAGAAPEYGWTDLRSDTLAPANNLLAEFDTSMLPNGQYELRLRVFDSAGDYKDSIRTVVVRGAAKAGPFTLPYTDLSLPAPGFPIQVTRTYDSTDKEAGDFGAGWRLAVSNVQVEKSRTSPDNEPTPSYSLSEGWEYGVFGLKERKPHFITITLPGGTQYAFYVRGSALSGDYATVVIDPLPGNTAKLQRADGADGTVYLQDDPRFGSDGVQLINLDDEPWDTDDFLLTLRDGSRYWVNTQRGLVRAEDRNGNALTITDQPTPTGFQTVIAVSAKLGAGGAYETIRKALINRDTTGLVMSVVDPMNHAVTYSYGTDPSTGRKVLNSFTDRASVTTHYTYDHDLNLLTISDPRNPMVAATLNHYDQQGRLVATEDAAGKASTFKY